MEKFIIKIILYIIERFLPKRSGVHISVKACLVEMKIPKSDCSKSDQIVKWVSITFINRSTHPIRIVKVVAFHYKDKVKKFLRKPDKGPIDIIRRDLFPLRLEASQTCYERLTSTDFYGNIPTDGFLLLEIYSTHSDKPVKKEIDLSRKKIEQNLKQCSV